MNTLNTVGHPTHRIDAEQRVTGTATYTGDIHLPGMLYARVLRSPHPHARIKRVDTSAAEALPGVKVDSDPRQLRRHLGQWRFA